MSLHRIVIVGALSVAAVGRAPNVAWSQQATVAVPQNRVTNGFHEHYGIGWGVRGPNFFFNNGGGAGATVPPFGGYDPNAATRFGWGGRNSWFHFSASQGADRTLSSTTPMITLPNGGAGSIYNTTVRPFVIGAVPVVGEGGGPSVRWPLAERLERMRAGEKPSGTFVRETDREADGVAPAADVERPAPFAEPTPVAESPRVESPSSAARGDLSVAEIRRQQAAEEAAAEAEVAALVEQARGQEQLGKPGVAKIYYQQAARRATGRQKQQLLEKIRSL